MRRLIWHWYKTQKIQFRHSLHSLNGWFPWSCNYTAAGLDLDTSSLPGAVVLPKVLCVSVCQLSLLCQLLVSLNCQIASMQKYSSVSGMFRLLYFSQLYSQYCVLLSSLWTAETVNEFRPSTTAISIPLLKMRLWSLRPTFILHWCFWSHPLYPIQTYITLFFED